MPIGLIYIVTPSSYPTFQHLASGVEITTPWSCYFQLSIPEKPDDTGSWELEETRCYVTRRTLRRFMAPNWKNGTGKRILL